MTDVIEALAKCASSARSTLAADEGKRRFASDIDPSSREINYHYNPKGAKNRFSWQAEVAAYDHFVSDVLSHREQAAKDGPVYVPGRLIGNERNVKAVAHIDCLVFDLDVATPNDLNLVSEKIQAWGLACAIHSTFSYQSGTTSVPTDQFHAYCAQMDFAPQSREGAKEYLREKKRYPESIVATASVRQPMQQTANGVVTVLAHEPLFKLRVVFPLGRSYSVVEVMKRGFSEEDVRGRVYVTMLKTVAEEFGLAYDTACKDVCHCYFAAAYPTGRREQAIARKMRASACG